jgi:phosphomevalonate kinase
MLSGEYAVLHGGTTVLMPVPRYLTVSESIEANPSKSSPVIRAALGFPIDELHDFECKNQLAGVEVDYSEFYGTDELGKMVKLGIGSSAAEAVGVIGLRFERAGLSWDDHAEMIAVYADHIHRTVQGGLGSGADIATCAFRKPIKFKHSHKGILVDQVMQAPGVPKIPMHLVWSGQPADTRMMVERFESWVGRSEEKTIRLMQQLLKAASDVSHLWFRMKQEEFFPYLDKFVAVLIACAADAGLPFILPIHAELAKWAEEHGGRAKPTGAGGGDMILLLGDLPVDELKYPVIPLEY